MKREEDVEMKREQETRNEKKTTKKKVETDETKN